MWSNDHGAPVTSRSRRPAQRPHPTLEPAIHEMAPAGEGEANADADGGGVGTVKGGRKRKYLPHGKPVWKGT
jgi:hypothetical protein